MLSCLPSYKFEFMNAFNLSTRLKFVSAIEYPFNTQSLFFFTQIMTAITIIGIILIIPIYAGPSIAILE